MKAPPCRLYRRLGLLDVHGEARNKIPRNCQNHQATSRVLALCVVYGERDAKINIKYESMGYKQSLVTIATTADPTSDLRLGKRGHSRKSSSNSIILNMCTRC